MFQADKTAQDAFFFFKCCSCNQEDARVIWQGQENEEVDPASRT